MSSLAPVRARSPRYPSHSLEQALEFARRIYEGVHRSAVDSLTAVKLMGFAGRSGASATALGSVRQYGLIEGVGDRTRISELGLSILQPGSESERLDSIEVASRQPHVFGQILERFDGRLPAANEPVVAYLIRELDFSKSGAEDCLASLRTTQTFVDSLESSKHAGTELQPRVAEAVLTVHGQSSMGLGSAAESPRVNDVSDLIIVPLSKDCRVEMRFYGQISERALSKLARYIDLLTEDWVAE
jgi:hypothetical protein